VREAAVAGIGRTAFSKSFGRTPLAAEHAITFGALSRAKLR
jgi:hypothetical protein